jgi:hypothetical protein
MSNEKDEFLKVGDIAEFHMYPNKYSNDQTEWKAMRVEELRITQEYEDKEGVLVSQVKWSDIRDFQCLVVVCGTEKWGRNEDVRPLPRTRNKK